MLEESIVVCWSGGKDSTMMLYELFRSRQYRVAALLTTMTKGFDRISMHGVRRELLEAQAHSLGLRLHKVYISQQASNQEYESKMEAMLRMFMANGIQSIAFGDIFLEDLKKYREDNLRKIGMKGIFPIWKRDTTELVRTFIDLGFKAYLSCIDTKVLDSSFAGRLIDQSFLNDLPKNIDPCGENGEFHTFVFDGPLFRNKIECEPGEIRMTERFCFRDLVPKKAPIIAIPKGEAI